MDSWHGNRLSKEQAELVETWLPGVRMLNDLSWDLTDTAVLEVQCRQRRYVVKAGSPSDHHIEREIAAHQSAVHVLARQNRAPRLIRSDLLLNILVTEYLGGSLVEGSEAEYATAIYVQAGSLLRAFHDQAARTDQDSESAATAKALAWLYGPHRIEESAAEQAAAILGAYEPEPFTVVPTHGDWQPRNWLISGSELRVIDFGRYEFRPAASDFCRLAAQQWRAVPRLEAAFFAGYGSDPRDTKLWNVMQLREAVSTAAWAYRVGDHKFEEQGHRMLRDALGDF